jgi:quercetin dioxygenase-like cupin family protein
MPDKNVFGPNLLHTKLDEVLATMGPPPWSQRLVLTDRIQGVLICQAPGKGNRTHFHTVEDEWWVILGGELVWEFEGQPPIHAKKGDVVFAPHPMKHHIYVVGDEPALRLAIAMPDIEHIWVDEQK